MAFINPYKTCLGECNNCSKADTCCFSLKENKLNAADKEKKLTDPL